MKKIYGKLRVSIGQILRKLLEMKDSGIIETNEISVRINILVRILQKISISSSRGYLKNTAQLYSRKNMRI